MSSVKLVQNDDVVRDVVQESEFPPMMELPVLVRQPDGREIAENHTMLHADRFAVAAMGNNVNEPPHIMIQQGLGDSGLFTMITVDNADKLQKSLAELISSIRAGKLGEVLDNAKEIEVEE